MRSSHQSDMMPVPTLWISQYYHESDGEHVYYGYYKDRVGCRYEQPDTCPTLSFEPSTFVTSPW